MADADTNTDPKPELESWKSPSGGVPESTQDLLATVGDMFIQGLAGEGPLTDLPVLGTALKLKSAYHGVSDQLLLRKLGRFLSPYAQADPDGKAKFIENMDEDPQYREKVKESIILLVDKHEAFEKSELLGRAFVAYLANEITYEMFRDLGTLIDRTPSGMLTRLPELLGLLDSEPNVNGSGVDSLDVQMLTGAGLVVDDAEANKYFARPLTPSREGAELARLIQKGGLM